MNLPTTFPDRPIGAFVDGVSLPDLEPDSFETLLKLVHERSVVTIRRQTLSQAEQVAFARRFGDLQKIFIKEATALEFPELFFVSNVTENGRPIGSADAGKFWHTDGAYLAKPHALSMLYAIEVPMKEGAALGDTLFAGMAAAYDALPGDIAQRLDGLRAVHSLHHRYGTKAGVTDMALRAKEFPPVSHPLVVHHPVTGRKCLYVSEGYTTHIEGMPMAESNALLEMLCAHVTSDQFVYRHTWAPGDLVIWDNRATLHRATFDYEPTQRRLMRRATVSGESLG